MTHILQHDNSAQSQEWYTPQYIIDAVRDTLFTIDLDPASCEFANEVVMASKYFTRYDNALGNSWYGNVWMNPPYGKTKGRSNQDVWFTKLEQEYLAGNIEQALSLYNVSVGSKWFSRVLRYPTCFLDKRIAFYDSSGEVQKAPRYGNCVVHMGQGVRRFVNSFNSLGVTMETV